VRCCSERARAARGPARQRACVACCCARRCAEMALRVSAAVLARVEGRGGGGVLPGRVAAVTHLWSRWKTRPNSKLEAAWDMMRGRVRGKEAAAHSPTDSATLAPPLVRRRDPIRIGCQCSVRLTRNHCQNLLATWSAHELCEQGRLAISLSLLHLTSRSAYFCYSKDH
jgi:hypothetical protein